MQCCHCCLSIGWLVGCNWLQLAGTGWLGLASTGRQLFSQLSASRLPSIQSRSHQTPTPCAQLGSIITLNIGSICPHLHRDLMVPQNPMRIAVPGNRLEIRFDMNIVRLFEYVTSTAYVTSAAYVSTNCNTSWVEFTYWAYVMYSNTRNVLVRIFLVGYQYPGASYSFDI